MLDVAVVIVSWNVRNYLANCLRSVCAEEKRSGLGLSTWVVDNASTDGSSALVADLFPRVNLINNDVNSGYGRGMYDDVSTLHGFQNQVIVQDITFDNSYVPVIEMGCC